MTNKTIWDGKALRSLCLRAIKSRGSHKRHQIFIDYQKNGAYHGRAMVNGNWITMAVPRPDNKYTSWEDREWERQHRRYGIKVKRKAIPVTLLFNSLTFCQVLEHEIDHNLGLRHKDMGCLSKFNCDYAKDIFVAPLFKTPEPKVDIIQVRYQRAVANFKVAQTRHKRATTLLKKWDKKIKYYEKKEKEKSK